LETIKKKKICLINFKKNNILKVQLIINSKKNNNINEKYDNKEKILVNPKKINNKSFYIKLLKSNKIILINKNYIFLKKSFLKKYKFNTELVKELSFLSYFIGSIFPGHGALISSIDINVPNKIKNIYKKYYKINLKYFNKSLKSTIINFNGIFEYKIITLFLTQRKDFFSKSSIKKKLKKKEFNNTKSLIIGGSRGIGAIVGNILSIGDGKVFATSTKKIQALNKKIYFIKFNINKKNDLKNKLANLNFSYLYYFPTPKIFINKHEIFNRKIFDNFQKYYIDKFYEICVFFETKKKKLKIFYPSTTSLINRPLNMTEYTMAKSASEIMIEDLNRSLNFVEIEKYRLPRLDTDQTINALGIKSINAEKMMLKKIRKFVF
jgi:hypothetical protein